MIGVIDGDNFFASIEQLLNPAIQRKAVVVLSSNDGNVISRSKQAKALGIKMGVPKHEIQPLITAGTVIAQSANFPTYEIMSRRLEWATSQFTSLAEPYSCDELFYAIDPLAPQEILAMMQTMRRQITRWVVPVSIGVGRTKSLAKAAITESKATTGLCLLRTPAEEGSLLAKMAVDEVWGCGPRKAAWLRRHDVLTARDLRDAPLWWIRQHLSVVTARTVLELRGTPAFPLITERATAQEIMINRSFGAPVETLKQLQEAIIFYTTRACEKLRAQQRQARCLSVSLATNSFRKHEPQYAQSVVIHLPRPTNMTPAIVAAALDGLERIYRPYPMHRAGIRLFALSSDALDQGTLLPPAYPHPQERALMHAIDAINTKWGSETIRLLGSGMERPWASRFGNRSPRSLTQWAEIPVAVMR